MTSTIVVGVDGSEPAAAAVRWAAEEARIRGATLRVVNAWEAPLSVALPEPSIGGVPLVPSLDPGEVRSAFEDRGGGIIDTALEGIEGLEVERRIVDGDPAVVLVEESRDAAMLVVGKRQHGSVAGFLLGSVSRDCIRHAACPVVVVPA